MKGLDFRYINSAASLPYGLQVVEVIEAVEQTCGFFREMSNSMVSRGYQPFCSMVGSSCLSGLLSEVLVKNLALSCGALSRNGRTGGHPDLLPQGYYDECSALRGDEGLEVKVSVAEGRWQGHNPEDCWLMVFRYCPASPEGAATFQFVEILCAYLLREDWNFSGRRIGSRRTPVASTGRSGMEKLRSNFIYRLPNVGVGQHRNVLAHPGSFSSSGLP